MTEIKTEIVAGRGPPPPPGWYWDRPCTLCGGPDSIVVVKRDDYDANIPIPNLSIKISFCFDCLSKIVKEVKKEKLKILIQTGKDVKGI